MLGSIFWKKLLIRTGVARHLPLTRRLYPSGTAYLHQYSDRVLAAPVAECVDPIIFPETPGPDVLNLNQPTPEFEGPGFSGRNTVEVDRESRTWGLRGLREVIAERYREDAGRSVDPEKELLISHGATGALAAILDAFLNPGDAVVLFDPVSPLFSLGAKSRRARIRWVPSRVEDGFTRFDDTSLAQAMRGAKLLILADPVNPTGGRFHPDDLQKIASLAERQDLLLVLDETFARFQEDGGINLLPQLPAAKLRTLVIGSVSAGYGLSQSRIGWVSGPTGLIQAAALMANLTAPGIPPSAQLAAVKALQSDDERFGPVREELRDRCRYTLAHLRAIGIQPTRPSGGYFLWLPVHSFAMTGREFAERLLKQQRVLVGPGEAFGPSGSGFVRLSVAGDDGRLREGLGRIAKFLGHSNGANAAVSNNFSPDMADPGTTREAEPLPTTPIRPPVFSRV